MYETLRPEMKSALADASRKIGEKYDVAIETNIGEVIPLGSFDESDKHLSTVWLADTSYEINGEITKSKQVQVSTAIFAGARVFVLFTYGEYGNASDVEKYKAIAKEWTKVFLRDNP